MSHESVWYSRPRSYGKGARQWYVDYLWKMVTLREKETSESD
jgi:hypothetical protein